MKPAAFDYYQPRSLDEALSLLAAHGSDAKALAGGQSLIPAMNFRLATPAVLVDLNEISEIGGLKAADYGGPMSYLSIGAMTRHRTVERSEAVRTAAPLMSAAMPYVAHPAIRTRGTIGGSLAHADPAAELPAVMLALEATLLVRGATAAREIPASEFFTGLFTTALEPGELLTEIRIPAQSQAERVGWGFLEFSRRHGDFALAGVAATVALDDHGRCTRARLALFSVGDRPLLASRAAGVLIGQTPSPALIREAAEIASSDEIDPTSDIHASSRYRRQLARVLTTRVLTAACEMSSRP